MRLAGIDSPEGPHFGKPGQPFFEEAKARLTKLLENKSVTFQLHRLDQYHRAVINLHFRSIFYSFYVFKME